MKTSRAFTLLELLIVLLIIGILIAIGLYRYQAVVEASSDKKAQSQVRGVFINAKALMQENDGVLSLGTEVDGISVDAGWDSSIDPAPNGIVGVDTGNPDYELLVVKNSDSNNKVFCMAATNDRIIRGEWQDNECRVSDDDGDNNENGFAATPDDGGWIYFTSTSHEGPEKRLYKMRDDGTERGLVYADVDLHLSRFELSPDRSRIALAGGHPPSYLDFSLRLVGTNGTAYKAIEKDNSSDQVRNFISWSADGTTLGWIVRDGQDDLLKISNNTVGAITTINLINPDTEERCHPQTLMLSPDGSEALYDCSHGANSEYLKLYKIATNGSGTPVALTTAMNVFEINPVWSPTDNYIFYLRAGLHPVWGGMDARYLHRVDLNGGGDIQISPSDVGGIDFSISPDGQNIAYIGNGGKLQVVDKNGQNAKTIVSSGASSGKLSWSPDGSKIVYRCETPTGYGRICLAPSSGTELSARTPISDVPGPNNNGHDDSPTWSGFSSVTG